MFCDGNGRGGKLEGRGDEGGMMRCLARRVDV